MNVINVNSPYRRSPVGSLSGTTDLLTPVILKKKWQCRMFPARSFSNVHRLKKKTTTPQSRRPDGDLPAARRKGPAGQHVCPVTWSAVLFLWSPRDDSLVSGPHTATGTHNLHTATGTHNPHTATGTHNSYNDEHTTRTLQREHTTRTLQRWTLQRWTHNNSTPCHSNQLGQWFSQSY